jgi:CSLREA domain-containing protein
MSKRKATALLIALLCGLLVTGVAWTMSSASYAINWDVIASGGGYASLANYTLDGSAGQPVVGTLSGGPYTLVGGFWPGIVAETPTPTPTGSPPPTSTPTATPTPTPTVTGSPPPTSTPTSTRTGTVSPTPTATATGSPPPTSTPTATPTGPPPALVVNTTDDMDDGTCDATHCSLREAIKAAELHAGPDTIAFNIPGDDPGCDAGGVCTIQPACLLPILFDGGTTIDGYTQPGASSGSDPVLRIVLDGYDNGSFVGLGVESANNVIRGLVIQRFTPVAGIVIGGPAARNNRVEGCFIGTDATGTQPRGNCSPSTYCGAIQISVGAQGNTIGPGNLIAFNGRGVYVVHSDTLGNTITRNRIHSNAEQGIWLLDGGNEELPAPVITTASATQVSGTACSNCTIEVFSDAEDEGAIYEGPATADASGNWTLTKPGGLTGPYVTATATDGDGNTSEFSAPVSLPQVTPTGTVSPVPTATATGSPSPTATPTATPTPSPTPTATLPPGCQELLINGDFETGSLSPWGNWGNVGLGSGHNSAYGAWLGGANNAEGELLQSVTIAAGASPVELEFWWLAESESEQPSDSVGVYVQYEQADLLHTLRAEEPLGQWQQEALDLSAYAGLDVGVTFFVHTDGEVPSTFRLDDVSLQACGVAPPTPTCTPTGTVSPTPAQHVYLPIVSKSHP